MSRTTLGHEITYLHDPFARDDKSYERQMMTNDYRGSSDVSQEIKAFLMSRKVSATHALPTVNVNVIGIEPRCVKEKSTNRFWRNIVRPQRPCCSRGLL